MIEDRVNINGEFLGISSLAIYSAPWFLQLILLVFVVLIFVAKIMGDSKELNALAEAVEGDELDRVLSSINKVFFGFSVPSKNLSVYWLGFLIYLITLIYAGYNTYINF